VRRAVARAGTPDQGRRRIHGIETFNVLRGGEYLFMPNLSSLNWIADLDQPHGTGQPIT
jgi:hypothetical protein